MRPFLPACLIGAVACAVTSFAAETTLPTVEVTTAKLAEPVSRTPAMITVVSGEDLRARGATDLRSALSLVAGVDIAPGGDGGPASAVPGLWGLREFDAFLLVVDGVPAGGAFNPALATLDLTDVERIEVLRGAAPVMYGATSFVGVIQVIHYPAGVSPPRASIAAGTPRAGQVAIQGNLPDWGAFRQSLSANVSTQGFDPDRSAVDRGHALYRAAGETELGKLHFDIDGVVLRQDPYSPHPVEDGMLSPRFPLDANVMPRDARKDQDRLQFNAGLERILDSGEWVTTFSLDHSTGRNTEGFLRPDFADDGVTHNADGFRQHLTLTDAYFDTYWAMHPAATWTLTTGFDWLYGNGRQHSDNFEYAVLPSGANAPDSHTLPIDESTERADRRNFFGLYAQLDYQPDERWDLIAGLRLNHTAERSHGVEIDRHAAAGTPPLASADQRDRSRLSGTLGVSYALWVDDPDRLTAFADYRNTYKPAAIDFGPEAESAILLPETAQSWEAGMKGVLAGGRIDWEFSAFRMDFAHLVIPANVAGLPGLANGGKERFRGAEIEGEWRLTDDLRLRATYAYHDARYTDRPVRLDDGRIVNYAGNRLEVSPQNLAAFGLIYAPAQPGWRGALIWNHVGKRFLDQENQTPVGGYSTIDAAVGYRFAGSELRLDGFNLGDRRDPVAISELGDGQAYRLPGRSVLVSWIVDL
jgi:iron complex outermembrane receptor protein